MLSSLWGKLMEVEVLYQLEGVKEMLPIAMIVTTTLIFQFLFQFYSYLTVHFLLGNICTSNFGCHQTARNALIHLA